HQLLGFNFIALELSVSKRTYKLLRAIEKQVKWFRQEYPQRRPLDTWLIYFMGLIENLAINHVEAICKRFVFRKGEEKRILAHKKIGRKLIHRLSRAKVNPSIIFSLLEPLSYEIIILIKAKSENRNIQRRIKDFFEIYNGMRPYISGDDLSGLGIAPGPYYQKIFSEVLNAKLNGRIRTKQEELALIKKLVRT
ncbi:MAG: hypothetical protein KKE91_04915, partial [Candidatus Omnitrophica bacterium]|nr:hypothetical protein [Candidatus Omnitrophota bacterium]